MTRILIDLDNCGADFLKPLLNRVNEMRRENREPEASVLDVKDWDMRVGFTQKEQEEIHALWNAPGFFANLEPTEGFVDFVSWAKREHEPVICTAAQRSQALKDKMDWIERVLGGVIHPVDNAAYVKRKWMVEADVMIDDSPFQINNYKAHRPLSKIIVPRYPFNEHLGGVVMIDGCTNMKRFWQQAKRVLGYEEEQLELPKMGGSLRPPSYYGRLG